MPPTSLTTSTGQKLIASVGELYIGNTKRGVLDGPVRFDPGMGNAVNTEFAGKSTDVQDHDRHGRFTPSLSVVFKELDDTLLGLLMPGSTTLTAGGIITRTPPKAGAYIASMANVRAIFLLSDAAAPSYYEVRFPLAFPRRDEVAGNFPQAGTIGATFFARSPIADPDAAPWTEHFYITTIPTVS